jgi:hypothetical protein
MSTTRHARRGTSIPFSSRGPASSTTRLPAASRYAVGPTRISPGLAACCNRAARFTASPVANVDPDASLKPEVDHRLTHGERRPRRALCIVLVGLGNAERREDCVSGELLDDPAMLRDAVRHHLEELVHAAAHDLRVGTRHQARRVDDVDEQHCRELALHS